MGVLNLVLGGASSGKSAFAEQLTRGVGKPPTYIATAQAFDDEMRAKIEAHKRTRAHDGWTTIEAPLNIAGSLETISGPVLIDCATLWLSNLMLADRDIAVEIDSLLVAVRNKTITVVSNEVGQGIVPEHAMGRRFRNIQGAFNIKLAARADLVVQVTAGLPIALKGAL